jgi:hypothetical protein
MSFGIPFSHFQPSVSLKATGGTVTYANGYKIHTFTSSGTFQVLSGSSKIEYLVVGGGGGGGGSAGDGWNSGGGGAGGFLTGTKFVKESLSVIVGLGGTRGTSTSSNNAAGTTQGTNGGETLS